MPIYEYNCKNCEQVFEVVRRMQDYQEPAYCPKCSKEGVRKLSAPAVRGDYAGYQCPVTGQWVEGRKAHEENLKRTGCRLYEPGETQEFLRRKRQEEENFEHLIEESVAREVAALPVEKQQALAKELEYNPDVQITRTTAE